LLASSRKVAERGITLAFDHGHQGHRQIISALKLQQTYGKIGASSCPHDKQLPSPAESITKASWMGKWT